MTAGRTILIVAVCLALVTVLIVTVISLQRTAVPSSLTPTPTSGFPRTQAPGQAPTPTPEKTPRSTPVAPAPTEEPAEGEPVRGVPGQCWVFSGGGWLSGPCPDE